MRQHVTAWVAIALFGMATTALAQPGQNGFGDGKDDRRDKNQNESVQLGPRPFFLVNDMSDGPLKRELKSCSEGPFKKTDFSIGHRGERSSSPSTLASPMKPAPGWELASWSATSPSPRISSWCGGTRRTTCTRPPTSC